MNIKNCYNYFEISMLRLFRSKDLTNCMTRDEIYQYWVLSIFNEWIKTNFSKEKSLNENLILSAVEIFESYRPKAMEMIDGYLSIHKTFNEKKVSMH